MLQLEQVSTACTPTPSALQLCMFSFHRFIDLIPRRDQTLIDDASKKERGLDRRSNRVDCFHVKQSAAGRSAEAREVGRDVQRKSSNPETGVSSIESGSDCQNSP